MHNTDIGLVMRIGQETDHFHMTDTLAHEIACGKPILAVNLRGIAEIIRDGENGFLFDPAGRPVFNHRLTQLYSSGALRNQCAEKALESSRAVSATDLITEKMSALLHPNYV